MDNLLTIVMILLVILLLLGIVVALVAWRKRRESSYEAVDYRTFFVMGIILLSVSAGFMIAFSRSEISFLPGLSMFALGLIYCIIGLTNRDKWNKSAGNSEH
jgi:heme A synthase